MNKETLFRLDECDAKLRNQILLQQMSEALTDKERARLYGLPEGCRIRERAKIFSPEKLECGKYVWIGEGAMLDAQGGLSIGDYTGIGINVMIWSHTSHVQSLISETCKSQKGISYLPTKIGKNCYISGPSVIGPGVTVGDRVLISPFSFVDQDVPSGTVIRGHKDFRDMQERVKKLEATVERLMKELNASKKLPSRKNSPQRAKV